MVTAGTLALSIDVSSSAANIVTLTIVLDAGSIIGSAQKLLAQAYGPLLCVQAHVGRRVTQHHHQSATLLEA